MSDHRCGSTRTNSGEPCQQPVPEAGDRCRYHPEVGWASDLTLKQRRFVEEYTNDFNATQAAIRAGYSQRSASQLGYQLLQNPSVSEALERRMDQMAMTADEALKRLADWARGDIGDVIEVTASGGFRLDLERARDEGKLHLIHKLSYDKRGNPKVELYDAKDAVKQIAKVHGLFVDKVEHSGEIDTGGVLAVPVTMEEDDWTDLARREQVTGPQGNGAGGS